MDTSIHLEFFFAGWGVKESAVAAVDRYRPL